jgi:hypothetical protein
VTKILIGQAAHFAKVLYSFRVGSLAAKEADMQRSLNWHST